MAKGSRKSFRIRLLLTPEQKAVFKKLEKQYSSLGAAVRAELEKQQETIGGPVGKGLYAESFRRMSEHAPDLDEAALRDAVSACYDSAKRSIESGLNRPRRKPSLDVTVDPGQVSFSTSDRLVRIPYLGLVRFSRNRFIVPGSGPGTEDKAALWRSVRRISLTVFSNDPVLFVDCTSEEEGALRSSALASKRSSRRARRAVPELLR